ncbi:ATP synthase F1 subunit gamma [Vampirovibrio chlorellavorus]|uniref:ATP synthase F1 subunit gamma n=1 Tax=Vampirovibrio chlorellavorus TaxID=758823 RepID=UPI0026F36973|nr:ATP synthase F1 subunit gamma [Vampirovibrio chlorellavorus]
MPNLKDIRRRIKSVKSTQKITQAMRMVAAAKVKRAENRVKAARPYASEFRQIFSDVFNALKNHNQDISGSRYADLLQSRQIHNVGIVVISSDRGLCGNYNSAVIRQAFRLEKEIKARGLTPKFYLVGNKAIQAFARYSNSEILGRSAGISAAPTVEDANLIAQTMTQAFLDEKIDTIDVLSTHFVSMISYKVQISPVIPVRSFIDWEPELIPSLNDSHYSVSPSELKPELLLEPNAVSILDKMVPMFVSNLLYTLLLEGSASELAARMTAMSNATSNAGDMINRLTIQYNKVRQAAITQEILEIVGGAEALK